MQGFVMMSIWLRRAGPEGAFWMGEYREIAWQEDIQKGLKTFPQRYNDCTPALTRVNSY